MSLTALVARLNSNAACAIIPTNGEPNGVFFRPEQGEHPQWRKVEVPPSMRDERLMPNFVAVAVKRATDSAPFSLGEWRSLPLTEEEVKEVEDGVAFPPSLKAAIETALPGLPTTAATRSGSALDLSTHITQVVIRADRGEPMMYRPIPRASTAPTVSVDPDMLGFDPTKGIPLPSKGEVYYPVAMPSVSLNGRKGVYDVEVVCELLKSGRAPALLGLPGSGKTALAMAALALLTGSDDCVVIACKAGNEAPDLLGNYVPTPKAGIFKFIARPLLDAIRDGRPVVIDEFMRLSPEVAPLFYALLDGRGTVDVAHVPEVGEVTAAPGFRMIFTSNPVVEGARIDEPLFSRLSCIPMGTNWALVRDRYGVDTTSQAVITACENLDHRRRRGEVRWSPQFREVARWAEACKMFDSVTAARLELINPPSLISSAGNAEVVAASLADALGLAGELEPFEFGWTEVN